MMLLAIPLAMVLGDVAARCQPFGWRYSVSRFVYPRGDPRTHGYDKRFVVQATGNGRYFGRAPELVMAYGMNWPGDTARALMVRSRDGTVAEWDDVRSRVEYVPFTREHVGAWLEAYDDGLTGIDRAALATTIHDHVADLSAGRFESTDDSDPVLLSSLHYSLRGVTIVVVTALCYAAIAGALVFVLRVNLRRTDARLARQWRAEAARLGLAEPQRPG
jgi:hypothetical protein